MNSGTDTDHATGTDTDLATFDISSQMDLLNESSLILLNGRKLSDTSGKLTCHQYNDSSEVDLSIVSWDLYDNVQ